jgi:NADPH:quinone reductase
VRAAVIERHGTAPRIHDRPPPADPGGRVVVTTTAAPITPLDILCASGTSYFGPPALPYVPGV